MLHCGGCRVSMNQRVKWLDGWNAFLNMILRWSIALVLSMLTLMPCPVCLALSVSYHFRRFVRCNRISGCHVGLWMNLLRNKDRTPALGKLFNGWKMIVYPSGISEAPVFAYPSIVGSVFISGFAEWGVI